MKVELIDTARVIPYARNPRRNEAAIAKVAASIKEYGFRQPIVVDEEMVVIAGHTRLQAAQLAYKRDVCPKRGLTTWNEARTMHA